MKYAVIVGVVPMILAFLAGFFGATVPLGWPAYIGWFVLSVAVGAGIVALRKKASG